MYNKAFVFDIILLPCRKTDEITGDVERGKNGLVTYFDIQADFE